MVDATRHLAGPAPIEHSAMARRGKLAGGVVNWSLIVSCFFCVAFPSPHCSKEGSC